MAVPPSSRALSVEIAKIAALRQALERFHGLSARGTGKAVNEFDRLRAHCVKPLLDLFCAFERIARSVLSAQKGLRSRRATKKTGPLQSAVRPILCCIRDITQTAEVLMGSLWTAELPTDPDWLHSCVHQLLGAYYDEESVCCATLAPLATESAAVNAYLQEEDRFEELPWYATLREELRHRLPAVLNDRQSDLEGVVSPSELDDYRKLARAALWQHVVFLQRMPWYTWFLPHYSAIMLHEIGHHVAARCPVLGRIQIPIDPDEDQKDELSCASIKDTLLLRTREWWADCAQDPSSHLGRGKKARDVFAGCSGSPVVRSKMQGRIARYAEEILCDVFAARGLGPAYLLALASLRPQVRAADNPVQAFRKAARDGTLTSDPSCDVWRWTQDHPPKVLRLLAIAKECRESFPIAREFLDIKPDCFDNHVDLEYAEVLALICEHSERLGQLPPIATPSAIDGNQGDWVRHQNLIVLRGTVAQIERVIRYVGYIYDSRGHKPVRLIPDTLTRAMDQVSIEVTPEALLRSTDKNDYAHLLVLAYKLFLEMEQALKERANVASRLDQIERQLETVRATFIALGGEQRKYSAPKTSASP